jgi:hypothetical protein
MIGVVDKVLTDYSQRIEIPFRSRGFDRGTIQCFLNGDYAGKEAFDLTGGW